jgi:hypothetical protein
MFYGLQSFLVFFKRVMNLCEDFGDVRSYLGQGYFWILFAQKSGLLFAVDGLLVFDEEFDFFGYASVGCFGFVLEFFIDFFADGYGFESFHGHLIHHTYLKLRSKGSNGFPIAWSLHLSFTVGYGRSCVDDLWHQKP